MDPTLRRWWHLIDEFPQHIVVVDRWLQLQRPPPAADGHLHVAPTSVACLEGVVRISGTGRSIDLGPGQVLLIAAGVWHQHHPLRRGSTWFGQGFLPAFSDMLVGNHSRSWRGRLPSQPSRRLMETALAADREDDRCQHFAELMRQVLSETVDDLILSNPALQRMLARLWANLSRGVTVAELVQASALSRAQAYRIFIDGYGVPPREAIATARLWLAESILATGVPVTEVAACAGYPSADAFTCACKRVHGLPPSSIRRP